MQERELSKRPEKKARAQKQRRQIESLRIEEIAKLARSQCGFSEMKLSERDI